MSEQIKEWSVGQETRNIELNGCFLPLYPNGMPVQLALPDNQLGVTVFRDETEVSIQMAAFGVSNYSLKKITDGMDFLASIHEAGRRILLDPSKTERGTVRWTEVGYEQHVRELLQKKPLQA